MSKPFLLAAYCFALTHHHNLYGNEAETHEKIAIIRQENTILEQENIIIQQENAAIHRNIAILQGESTALKIKDECLTQELEKFKLEEKKYREKALKELATWESAANQEAEIAATQTKQLVIKWTEYLNDEEKYYTTWIDDARKAWAHLKKDCSQIQHGTTKHIRVDDTRKIHALDEEKKQLNNLVKKQKELLNKTRNGCFEAKIAEGKASITDKIEKIRTLVKQEGHGWIKEQKIFWDHELTKQEKLRLTLNEFRIKCVERFLKLEGNWNQTHFEW
jgi:hypothetical protein